MNACALEARLPPLPTLDFPRPPGRPARIGALLAVITALSAVDLYMTLDQMMGHGMFEGNPIVEWLVQTTNSAAAVALFKMVTVMVGVGLLYRARRHRSAELGALVVALLAVTVQWARYGMFITTLDPTDIEGLATQSGWLIVGARN
jgi:hypothetical protein